MKVDRALQPVEPTTVFVAFDSPAPSDPADPCRTGATFKYNNIGDHDGVTVCTFDANGNPAPTDATGSHLVWTISSTTSGEPNATRFNPDPPSEETTGSGATAPAGIDSIQGGGDAITVTLVDANGAALDSAALEKQVVEGCGRAGRAASARTTSGSALNSCTRDVPTQLTARIGRSSIRGHILSSEPKCIPDRSVTLFRLRRGRDDVAGTDTTGSRGRWRVGLGHGQKGRYHARVASSGATDDESGSTLTCLPDQSKTVRRG